MGQVSKNGASDEAYFGILETAVAAARAAAAKAAGYETWAALKQAVYADSLDEGEGVAPTCCETTHL
jgi:hypothetical protein